MTKILDGEIARLYAQALVAVARADDEIGPEEGNRLVHQIASRSVVPMPLDDLLLVDPLDHEQLAHAMRAQAGPFRGATLDPHQLARMIVEDAITVVLAKGHVGEQEAQQIIRFALALGCTSDEVSAMSTHLVPWLRSVR